MIRLFCDICGDKISELSCSAQLDVNDNIANRTDGCCHKCEKCQEILNRINVEEVQQEFIKLVVLEARTDIPKEGNRDGSDKYRDLARRAAKSTKGFDHFAGADRVCNSDS